MFEDLEIEVINRLKEKIDLFNGNVSGSVTYELTSDDVIDRVHGYVVPRSTRGEEANINGGYKQIVTEQISIIARFPLEDKTGITSVSLWRKLFKQIFRYVIGWSPYNELSPFVFAGEMELISHDRASMDVEYIIEASYQICNNDTWIGEKIREAEYLNQVDIDIDVLQPDGEPDNQIELKTKIMLNEESNEN